MEEPRPEPWLRGPLPGISPLIAPVLYAFQQAREDLAKHTIGLTDDQTWARPFGLAPLGFHLRHIAGSVNRLSTYLLGTQLGDAQMAALRNEMDPGEPLVKLLAQMNESLNQAEERIKSIDPAVLAEPRVVGRQQLPTTVMGLLIHIAEHTQRHVGQAIGAAKLARAGG
jgi:hypothetical protein